MATTWFSGRRRQGEGGGGGGYGFLQHLCYLLYRFFYHFILFHSMSSGTRRRRRREVCRFKVLHSTLYKTTIARRRSLQEMVAVPCGAARCTRFVEWTSRSDDEDLYGWLPSSRCICSTGVLVVRYFDCGEDWSRGARVYDDNLRRRFVTRTG